MNRNSMGARMLGLVAVVAVVTVAGCGGGGSSSSGSGGDKTVTIGFAQVGSESGWRTANTQSIKSVLTKENGFTLKFADAQQKPENQIQSIRSFIAQKVDVIAFSPVVTTGWDTVLEEAKAAKIPVILTDRAVDVKDDSLYASFIGSDFVDEGKRAGVYVSTTFGTAPISVVELQGTTGSAPAIDRKKGFAEAIAANPNIKVVASQTGNFTRSEGKQVMEGLLQSQPKIDVLFAHNDDMALGAIEAIEAAGKKPGQDIKIVSIDGVKDGMQALTDGKINYIVECNPLLGPDLATLAKKVADGGTVEKRIVTKDEAFDQAAAKVALPSRKY
ncbi:MAG: galactofuranose transport system substrate-binding protein [Actinomycetota bacterium]|nr:galactofuranose transport system substrate-binding protein [Actinomycetota bacterium]